MGSPLSGNLCEMVIRALETKTLPLFLSNIIMYGRYIDDVIILWKTPPDLRQFKTAMNNNPYGLYMELEQHSEEKIHFLDIEIKERTIQTEVYRKPTTIPSYIPINSCDPYSYKIAAFRTLVERAYSHSSTTYAVQQELAYIRDVAKDHGYGNIINKLCNQHLHINSKTDEEKTSGAVDKEHMERVPVTYNSQMKTIYNSIAKKKGIRIT
ncbi:uncharacterized protein LOC111617263 [Centruroides sculpturatus]|uniref:uncharacterized protein LOC111617263 n=1 Tax=Centruroides sculpturatus TaxID=218467 RepID=UPI000C6E0766|nr:uncharacterized protein LOC111617263 [Centruroides sculpturatus]